MTDDLRQYVLRQTPLGRLGTPQDSARLVEFLCSPKGYAVHATTRTVMFVAPVIGEKVVARFPVRRR
jgi:NAD(P)-dependent dehydrogenase (short-subunit alcohol dehydrogenase family)